MFARPLLFGGLLFGSVFWTAAAVTCAKADPAAGLQIASVGALSATESRVQKPVVTVVPAFQPAPVPDPDIDPPHGSARTEPSLTPALFSNSKVFDGDGYAPGSDPDTGLDKRRKPAAGLNWVVPVK
jgi:hypothetical protein